MDGFYHQLQKIALAPVSTKGAGLKDCNRWRLSSPHAYSETFVQCYGENGIYRRTPTVQVRMSGRSKLANQIFRQRQSDHDRILIHGGVEHPGKKKVLDRLARHIKICKLYLRGLGR